MNTDQYQNEIREALSRDDTRLGDVWRLSDEGKSPTEISQELNVSTIGFVYTYRSYIRAIEEGDISFSPSIAKQSGRALRSFLKRYRDELRRETVYVLESRARECDRRAADRVAVAEENTRIERQTTEAERPQTPGIYVYTYPHYHDHPVAPETDVSDDRTYLKIGMSEKDASNRVTQQATGMPTGMPERPRLLQIWVSENAGDLSSIEKKIHEHLHAIGHRIRKIRRKEWFLTNEDSVASTASLLGLTCQYDYRQNDHEA